MAGSAPLIASFFREPQLVGISIALSAVFLLSGFAAQPLAVLNRQMQFGRVCVIELLSIAVGIAVGLTMAVLGSRHWALVGLTLSTAVSRLLATYALTSWRPARPTRGVGTRPLVTFGLNVTAVGFVYSFARLFDNLLIGRVLGSAAVGLYSRGTALVSRPLDQVVTPIYTVVVPALSRLQDQPDRYRKAFLQVFEALAIIAFLFTGLCLPLAYPLTVVILGPQWVAAAPIFAGLTISALFVPMSSAASWLYLSQGRGRELLFVASVSACTMIGSFVAGLPFGPAGVALAYSLGGVCLQLPVTFYVAGRRGPVSCGDLWLSLVRHLPLGIVVLGSIWALGALAPLSSPWMRLLWSLPVGGLAGAASILALPSSRRAAAWMWRSLREADFLGST
jgi:PST family polysaccharide transporter